MSSDEISWWIEEAKRKFADGSLDGAIAACQKVIGEESDNYPAHHQLAQSYELKGGREGVNAFFDLAIREVRILLEQHPNDPALHDWLIRLYRKKGKLMELASIYRKKLEADPYNEILLESLRKISTVSLLDIPSAPEPEKRKGLKQFSWLMDFVLLPFAIISLLLAIMIPPFRPSLSLGISLLVVYTLYKLFCLPSRRKEKGQW